MVLFYVENSKDDYTPINYLIEYLVGETTELLTPEIPKVESE